MDLKGISLIAMLIICGIFTAICVKSFINARKAK